MPPLIENRAPLNASDAVRSVIRTSTVRDIDMLNPEDPRMKEIESALWTWLLRVISMMDKVKDSPEVNTKLDYLAKQDLFKQLREMVRKAQVQELNAKEWIIYR